MSTVKFSDNLSQVVNVIAGIAKRERREFIQTTLSKAELLTMLRNEWEAWSEGVDAKSVIRKVGETEFNILGWKAFYNYLDALGKTVCGYAQLTKYASVYDNMHKLIDTEAIPEDKPLHKLTQAEWESVMRYDYDQLFKIGATSLNKLAPAIKSEAVEAEDDAERYQQLNVAINPEVNSVNPEEETSEEATEEAEETGFDTITLKVGRDAEGKSRSVTLKYRIEQFQGVDNVKKAVATAICTELGAENAIGALNVQEILVTHGVEVAE